jgi:H3 lysine-79-specific histone-lysine N-methyltransferase
MARSPLTLRSYGWELLPVPSRCARLQVAEVKKRWAMWGLAGNEDVQTIEGDFRDPSVAKKLKEADVVVSPDQDSLRNR